jgi:NTE family protein
MDADSPQQAAAQPGDPLDSPLAGLGSKALLRLARAAERRTLLRGEILLRRGEPSESLHFLATGRLAVVEDDDETVSEIAPGEPVGEIGFFARIPRTFTVRAIRDSEVLTLDRQTFEAISAELPEVRDSVIRSLALRLGRLRPAPKPAAPPRTVAVVAAGGARLSQRFLALLRKALGGQARTRFLSSGDAARKLGGRPSDDAGATAWLNALEADATFVFYIADDALTEWTRTCVRQADLLLLVARIAEPAALGEAETFAFGVHAPATRRLVLLHETRAPRATGTAAWLSGRDIYMHHHVSLQDSADVERVARFLTGRAVGFVAGGGGALGAAHLGVYRAFAEAGAEFDMFGGASVGAAMAAGLAMGLSVDEVDRRMHRMFVKRRAFRRFNFPYHSLLNHKAFDEALKAEFGEARIEDLWRPFFALSSDLTHRAPFAHREGPVWFAVRASSAIPGALPPCYTVDGRMLVDGGLFDNVPLTLMKSLKDGPNLVVALQADAPSRYAVDYEGIPGPREWLLRAATPWRRRKPHAPSLMQVIVMSLLANRRRPLELGPEDLLVHPDMPADVQWLQWRRHAEVYEAAYRGAARLIEQGEAKADPRLAALISHRGSAWRFR